ncbi:MAG: hypothetical protein BJBARM5_0155 [Candidatus Parvarchaeum acidophilus ARMAN-5]|jgi:hypothetical protein|uniref:Thioredoxin-like fold domain-containing protein n=1 Tax=Candidatus Parvarchaeum acidophilus ARMAN-5 TaxID=662762 RepID=D6GUL4_PARA5|nr:MAG: hypothetical protein BJBARM5_1076 [Candidatus Parvarchaeum acidophilus ARMAN-5]EFD93142.1 MAG: hypothetical protein BJBARM5_0155 [Candidatus Parvarchaeum acidophilus ARMAN-5]
MENKKSQLKKNKTKLLLAALAITFAISTAFALGYIIANVKVPLLQSQLSSYEQSIQSLSVLSNIGTSNSTLSCSFMEGGLSSLDQELQNLNSEITSADTNSLYSSYYSNLIKQLTYTRINYWLLAQRIKTQCGYQIANVLMLYPQNGCSNCGTEGSELYYLEQKSNYTIIATVIDADINISQVETIDRIYNVTTYPTLIINENNTYVGYENTQQLQKTICEYSPKLDICS